METVKKTQSVAVSNEVMEKPNYMWMSLKRIFLTIVISICVVLVVYHTPMPEEYFENCDRECHELDWPMICRVKLVIEVYKTLSKNCGSCTEKDGGACPEKCISADGRERGVLTVNRQLPAPPLHVCQNDILVVDVVHRAPAHTLAVHWRGQPQKETPFMDGAPMITQCPQPAYTTFQYKFRASAAGTHMYHAHSTADAADGLAGPLIVRQSPRMDPIRKLYDVDEAEHTIFIAEWGHSMGPLVGMTSKVLNAESLLINGRGRTTESPDAPLSKFNVKFGKKYRFRAVYAGGTKGCSVKISVQKHSMKLVALDGHLIEPVTVESVELGKGERADFILEANQKPGVFDFRVVADKSCQDNLEGRAELVYEGSDLKVVTSENEETYGHLSFTTVYSERCVLDNVLCLDDVRSTSKLSEELRDTVDRTIYVPFNYSTRQVSTKRVESWGQTDGFKFTYPESPLFTQLADVPVSTLCPTEGGEGEECVHYKKIDLGSTVELIIFDQGGESDHIFHLHGNSFFVTGIRAFNSSHSRDLIQQLNEQNTLFPNKNLENPAEKDTIVVPRFGVVALRFKADNPGFWLMRDERAAHWTRGLDFLLKVGEESDFVKPPVDFPKCGSYVGPEYFLI